LRLIICARRRPRPATVVFIRFDVELAPLLSACCYRFRRVSTRYSVDNRGIAQPGSAAVLGTAGRWFESSCPDQPNQWIISGFGRFYCLRTWGGRRGACARQTSSEGASPKLWTACRTDAIDPAAVGGRISTYLGQNQDHPACMGKSQQPADGIGRGYGNASGGTQHQRHRPHDAQQPPHPQPPHRQPRHPQPRQARQPPQRQAHAISCTAL
jgi:hypothetical protein